MPLVDIHLHGNMARSGSFREDDLRFLSSAKSHTRMFRSLHSVHVPVAIHFVNMPRLIPDVHGHLFGPNIGTLSSDSINRVYDVSIPEVEDVATIVFVQNEGGVRLPFTPWMVAHRIGHVFTQNKTWDSPANRSWHSFESVIKRIADSYSFESLEQPVVDVEYVADLKQIKKCEDKINNIPHFFGTTSACRRHKLFQWGEWYHECFAQWCCTGRLRFNQAKRVLKYKTDGYECSLEFNDERGGENTPANFQAIDESNCYESLPDIDQALAKAGKQLCEDFTAYFEEAVGKISVL